MSEGTAEATCEQAKCPCAALRPVNSDCRCAEWHGPCQYKDKSPRQREGRLCEAEVPRSYGEPPLPKHVRNCANRGARAWWLWTWKTENPETKIRRPYTCGSWRCDGDCATWNSHQLFARLQAAVSGEGLDPSGWVFLVLTIDRNGYYSGKPWPDAETAYRALSSMTERFLKRLRRGCEKRGWRDPGNRWAMVIESHMSGWPHANLMIYSPELACELRTEETMRELAGLTGRQSILLSLPTMPERGDPTGIRAWLGQHAVDTEWGLESTADGARNRDALAGYLVKMAGDPAANIGELAKITQRPISAPFKFRRLRSGKLFVPPLRKNEEYTGALVKRVTDWHTGYEYAMVPVPKGGYSSQRRVVVELAIRIEDRCREQDEERAWCEKKNREGPPAIPLVTKWLNETLVTETLPEPTTWDGVRVLAFDQIRLAAKARLRKAQLRLPSVSAVN